ncbi:Thioredoxin domain protein [Nannochloropsis gaditana]|uniref:Thioredoxin domain protein n=1 Tax=Nannochloropsis gaditana TaxID=72520 RepID=W7TC18_9STRA|nr:Thioredoxin domain protein [Nannochloropsis gaditana]
MAPVSSRGIKSFDFYRKVPLDLTEATWHGGLVSILAILFMLSLFVVELSSFIASTTHSTVVVDFNRDQQIRINFNITMLDVPCEFATVDVLDVLGTNQQNVTKNIEKWNLDQNAQRRMFQGRNREQRDLVHDDHHPALDLAHQDGEHALPLGKDDFAGFVAGQEYVFANFYAPWCVWCQRLAPTWEAFAEALERQQFNIKVVKIDCVEHRDLCAESVIRAFPTLRLYKAGKAISPDYREDRTVEALTSYIERTLDLHAKVASSAPEHREKIERTLFAEAEHPGCLLSGFLLVNRVPGNFHIEARSKYHNLNPTLTNVSHVVHDLTFGPPVTREYREKLALLPKGFQQTRSPLADQVYVVSKVHHAFHHYLKVVSTHYEVSRTFGGQKSTVLQYQMVANSQVMHYQDDEVPEAKFSYDISPLATVISSKKRAWYEFLTSLMAIIGGTFTVLGLLDHMLGKVLKPKKM